eukprot:TRINITY_DN8955_c0_g2_i3.p1 TRINITY_DN8955_c0_g2~~TRINITY_DN8955_c0_g2_i3.p1  ORF type:complete len:147 (-),score=51.33 TRINITY_DN8955_c0_g2_i3:53-493(-)
MMIASKFFSRFRPILFKPLPFMAPCRRQFVTDYTRTYRPKVELPKLEKSKLSSFFKAVHPDLFGSAPTEYREHNSRAMKELNNYITSLEQNRGAAYTRLEFYIRPKEESEEFAKRMVELLPIKAGVSADLLKMHICLLYTSPSPRD